MMLQKIRGLALFLGTAALASADVSLNNLVSDRAAVIVSVRDLPALTAEWNKSPWAKTWNDEQIKRYFAPMRTQMKIDDWDTQVKAKTGYTLSELLGFATGDAIVELTDFQFVQTTPVGIPPILIGIEVGANASKLEALIDKAIKDEKATDETSDFSGVKIHVIHPAAKGTGKPADASVWAIVDGKWLLSPSKDLVLAAIDGVHNGGVENPWGKSERWARLQQRAGDTQLTAAINFETVYPLVKSAIEERLKAGGAAANPFGVDAQTVLAALGLDTWREGFFTAKLGDSSTDFHAGLSYSELRGLTKMIAYHDGPVPTPDFVSGKWTSVTASKFSPKESYAVLEEILEGMSPALSGLVQGQIRTFNKKLGIDLKRDLLGSMGDTIIFARGPVPGATGKAANQVDLDQFFAISLQNPDTFSGALDAFRRLLGPQAETFFKTRDFLGQKITTFQAGQPGASPAGKPLNYAIAKGYFFLSVGSASPVEAALRGADGKENSIWKNADVADAFNQTPAKASAFEYENISGMMGTFFKAFTNGATLMNRTNTARPAPSGNDSTPDAPPAALNSPRGPIIDPSAEPDLDTLAKYWSYGWGYVVRDSSGLYSTSQIVYPK